MRIDDEFASLIPALREDEYQRLETSILNEGCRDAIVLWGEIIVDGHNRYNICTKHNIPFNTVQKEFASRDEVKLWMLQNQLSRRNLSDFDRIEMVRKCEDAIKAQAKARQGARNDLLDVKEKKPEGAQSRDELGTMAGVSGKTYEHAVRVLDKAPEAVIQATRDKELSINAAFEVTKLPEDQQAEIAERIEQGETPKAVVSSMRKAKKKAQPKTMAKHMEKKSEPDIPATAVAVDPIEFFGASETLQTESEPSKKEFVIIELLEVTETFHRIMEEGQSDCIMFVWLKPNDMQKLFNAIIFTGSEFKYHGLAFVWSHEGIIKEVCVVGTRGKAKVTTEIQPRVIEAETGEDGKHPKLFDDILSGMFENATLSNETPSEDGTIR